MRRTLLSVLLMLLPIGWTTSQQACAAAPSERVEVQSAVADAVRPVMKQYGIPGMAVGVTVAGRHFVFDFGVASISTRKRVDDSTLFEIGSVTKTLTASLVSYAQATGALSLSDDVGADYPPLRGTGFDRVRLENLGTHTAGSLPLQFPGAVRDDADAMAYYRSWKPAHAAGTYRLYSNPGIMLLGLVAAHRMHANFSSLLQSDVLSPLGLRNTFLNVPADRLASYAQGYTSDDRPTRLSERPLAPEAYGIRTTASDMLRFIDANVSFAGAGNLGRAIIATHSGYFRVGAMTQDLVWEQYSYPAGLSTVLQGNSGRMMFDENRVVAIHPPARPKADVLINKTGSTNGFSSYLAFVPREQLGVVVLANKQYPIAARVTAGYQILMRLIEESSRADDRLIGHGASQPPRKTRAVGAPRRLDRRRPRNDLL